MDHILSIFDQPESIYSIKLSYLFMTIAVIYIGQIIYGSYDRNNREKFNLIQRELYYKKLTEDSLKMEERQLKEDLELAKSIENLHNENNAIRRQLDNDQDCQNDVYDDELDPDESDWSSNSEQQSKSVDISSSAGSEAATAEAIAQQELAQLEEKAKELEIVDEDINKSVRDLGPCQHINGDNNEVTEDNDANLNIRMNELDQKLKQLEEENEELKSKLKIHQQQGLVKRESDLDPELIKYLEQHEEELTLEFLEKAYEILLEIKASNPDKSFKDYIEELRVDKSNRVAELTQLRVAKKEAEIKLQHWKRLYDEELSSFDTKRVEHIFKNSGAKEYVELMKKKNKLSDETIAGLRSELELKRQEINVWESKYREADAQFGLLEQKYKETLSVKDQLEAERRANQEKERRLINQSMNLSSASSLIDSNQIPPPPPLNVPPVDEILRSLN